LKSILFAFYQLTRLPLPCVIFEEKSCGRSTAFFPAVGLLLGLILAALAWAAQWCFPEQVRAALLVTGLIVLTGGIHLDGFMDSIDGLLSGRPRERKLEIMRDSRVGAFGVTGAVCLLLTKYTLILGLPGQSLTWVLITVPVLSRWSMVFAITAFPYARLEGLGKVYAVYAGRKELLIATLIAALVAGLTLNLLGAGQWLQTLQAVQFAEEKLFFLTHQPDRPFHIVMVAQAGGTGHLSQHIYIPGVFGSIHPSDQFY
jgi:adenosylcobinamide-GDP ribazoletransferase